MTDLEITKLCAEAMGFKELSEERTYLWVAEIDLPEHEAGWIPYNPLHDDAQAMVLLRLFRLRVNYYGEESPWSVSSEKSRGDSEDLNRAICECVAKMQAARTQLASQSTAAPV